MSALALLDPGSESGADVSVSAGVSADEVHRLHEHARRAAAWVVHPTAVGLDHLDQQSHNRARGVELAALPALGERELVQEVLVNAADNVGGLGLRAPDLDVADEVDDLAEPPLVQGRTRVVPGQHALERGVVALDCAHRGVNYLADGGLPGLGLEVGPSRIDRHPEDVLGAVLIRMLWVGSLVNLVLESGVGLLEGVGDVLEKDQSEDDVLVLGGVHAAPERVGHPPQLGLVSGDSAAVAWSAPGLGGGLSSACCGHCVIPTLVIASCPNVRCEESPVNTNEHVLMASSRVLPRRGCPAVRVCKFR